MKKILTEKQKRFIIALKDNEYILKNFYLTGGTALAAYYLHHRHSDDLDFFCPTRFDVAKIDHFIEQIADNLGAIKTERQRVHDRYIYVIIFKHEQLKTEFVTFEHKTLQPFNQFDGIPVDSEYDIAVNKLFTIQDRTETKDFVDLYFLLQKYPLDELIKGVENKFGFTINKIALGGTLMKLETITLMPKMYVPLKHEELAHFFRNLAYGLKKDIFE